jgi:hypothetical protein
VLLRIRTHSVTATRQAADTSTFHHETVRLTSSAVAAPRECPPQVKSLKFGTPASGCLPRSFLKPYLSPPPRSFSHRHVTSQHIPVTFQRSCGGDSRPRKTDRHPEIARLKTQPLSPVKLNLLRCKPVASRKWNSCAGWRCQDRVERRLSS